MSTNLSLPLASRAACALVGAAAAVALHLMIVAIGTAMIGWSFDVVLHALTAIVCFLFALLFTSAVPAPRARVVMLLASATAAGSALAYFGAVKAASYPPPYVEWITFAVRTVGEVSFAVAVANLAASRKPDAGA